MQLIIFLLHCYYKYYYAIILNVFVIFVRHINGLEF